MRSILISSSRIGEGKTSFAANLALTLAASGQKTLLVDADLRSPSLATVFGADPADGKLTELLVGEVELEDALHQPGYENLDVLLAGHPPTNPAELLGSQQFRDLLVELVKRYDRVVIDSPPVGPVTDSKLLSQVVDVMIMVVRQNVSDRFSLNHSLRQLRDVEADILGCVFNSADIERDKYGYGYGYGDSKG